MRLLALVGAAVALGLTTGRPAISRYSPWPPGTVCGQSRCFAVHGRTSAALLSWETSSPWAELDPPAPAAYYTIRFRNDLARNIEIREQVLYVPSRHMVRVYDNRTTYGPEPLGPYWRRVSKSAARTMNRVVDRIAPHHRPKRGWPRP